MDDILPGKVLSELQHAEAKARRARSRHLVVAGPRKHRVLELTHAGFVIEADGLPHLRGYVDILLDEERISRRLAQFAWARDGLVGYEFKHEGGGREAPADYEKPARAGLLGGPEGEQTA